MTHLPATRLVLGVGVSMALLAGCTTRFTQQRSCGDGIVGGEEVCDGSDLQGASCQTLGFYAGTLACSGDCAAYDTSACVGRCGDGVVDVEEACDGSDLRGASCQALGFYAGALACSNDCMSLDTRSCTGRCGDGAIDPGEACDGTNLAEHACEDLGFYAGTLACASDCVGFDTSGCAGRCGDGVVNGPEVCDGLDLGGRMCSDLGYWGGTLACQDDCGALVQGACWAEPHVVINELSLSVPDWVELLNVSERPVDLSGWQVRWTAVLLNGSFSQGTLTLPAGATLAAGARLVLVDQVGGDGSPPTLVAPDFVQAHENINWGFGGGSALLADGSDAPVDFARWGSSTEAPAGAAWSDGAGPLPAPGATNMTAITLSRAPDGGDADSADDFCVTGASQNATNVTACRDAAPPGALLLTEVMPGTDRMELFNPGATPVDLSGWWLASGSISLTAQVLPAFSLGAGQYVRVDDDASDPLAPFADTTGLHVGYLSISTNRGSIALISPAGGGVDFVQWGWSGGYQAPTPDHWSGGSAPAPASGQSLARSGTTDTDTAADWCEQPPSLGQANGVCP